MGFRANTYAKCWEVTPKSERNTVVRLSVSRKNKDTGEILQEFSGFVSFVGTAAAKKAACLKSGDRIKLIDVDVTTNYDKEKNKEYVNYKCFSFEDANFPQSGTPNVDMSDPQPAVDSGDVDDARLPF